MYYPMTLRNELRSSLKEKYSIFRQEDAFENYKISAILFFIHVVKQSRLSKQDERLI